MSLSATASRLFRGVQRTQLVPAAKYVTCKPPKFKLSPAEQGTAMLVLFTAILGPSGWVLCHLEDYKTRK